MAISKFDKIFELDIMGVAVYITCIYIINVTLHFAPFDFFKHSLLRRLQHSCLVDVWLQP